MESDENLKLKQKVEDLMNKRNHFVEELRKIEDEISSLCGSISNARDMIGKSKIGRPKGSTNKKSLDSIVIDTIYNSVDGVTLEDVVKNIISEGYVSNSSPKDFINIIRSRLSVLKKNKKIIRDEQNLKYKKV